MPYCIYIFIVFVVLHFIYISTPPPLSLAWPSPGHAFGPHAYHCNLYTVCFICFTKVSILVILQNLEKVQKVQRGVHRPFRPPRTIRTARSSGSCARCNPVFARGAHCVKGARVGFRFAAERVPPPRAPLLFKIVGKQRSLRPHPFGF